LIELYIRIGKGVVPLLRGSAHGSIVTSPSHNVKPDTFGIGSKHNIRYLSRCQAV